jgi:hypothetical protein
MSCFEGVPRETKNIFAPFGPGDAAKSRVEDSQKFFAALFFKKARSFFSLDNAGTQAHRTRLGEPCGAVRPSISAGG